MVVGLEGLRAPAIGQALGSGARAVAPGRAAAAIGAAALIGASGGTALGNAGATFQNGYTPTNLPSRFAPPPAASALEQGLAGAQGLKAPSLGGRALDGLAKPLAAAGAAAGASAAAGEGGLGGFAGKALPQVGRGLASVLPKAASLAGKLAPLGWLPTILDFAKGDPLADEAGRLNAAKSKALTDRQTARNKQQRKGTKAAPSTKPDLRTPPIGQAGVIYHVLGTGQFKGGDIIHFDNLVEGPIGGTFHTSADGIETYGLIAQGGKQQIGAMSAAQNNIELPYNITSITRQDGVPIPPSEPYPPEFFEDGSPLIVDTTPQPNNSDQPALPEIATKQPNPAKTSGLPPTSAQPPTREANPPSNPAAPNQTVPSVPNVDPPLSPTSPSLPSIPSAPSMGSATAMAPIFPATFTRFPAVRNENSDKPIEPEEPDPPENVQCSDPCLQSIRQAQKESQKKDEPKGTQDLSVRVFKNCDGDNPTFEYKTVRVAPDAVDSYALLYDRIANLEALQCSQDNCIAAVPEWWQVRIEGKRPQLVILFAQKKPDGSLGRADNPISIPHASSEMPQFSPISAYTKGQVEGILTLSDNSKLIVNARDAGEAERVINEAMLTIDPRLISGSFYKVGTRKGQPLRTITVYPKYAKYFSSGLQNTKPDWTVYLGS